MAIPLIQQARVGAYIIKQRLFGAKRYPLVLMLEPLFRCNLVCAGCGKIDYPDAVLNKRLSVQECLDAVDECGAPIVSIPGGEPLLHGEIKEIVEGLIAKRKFVYLCTNALLLEKRLDLFKPSPYLTFSIHLDGDREIHVAAVCQDGVFDQVISAIREAHRRGFRININSTLFEGVDTERMANFFNHMMELDVEGITVSPGFSYERAPDQDHVLKREKTRQLFRDIFRHNRKRKWRFSHSSLFLDFLAGNQTYHCTPWGNPTRNIFGWQRPCYLLDEGYAGNFKELMEETDWQSYGAGNYEKCANCMAHCGYEATAVTDIVAKPWKAVILALRGIRTEGPMALDIALENARPAEYARDERVEIAMKEDAELKSRNSGGRKATICDAA